jgi:DNA-directed RNA polymerase sigma subunit (sigma70/sigma32)
MSERRYDLERDGNLTDLDLRGRGRFARERRKHILRRNAEDATTEMIAAELGVSEARVRQITADGAQIARAA